MSQMYLCLDGSSNILIFIFRLWRGQDVQELCAQNKGHQMGMDYTQGESPDPPLGWRHAIVTSLVNPTQQMPHYVVGCVALVEALG